MFQRTEEEEKNSLKSEKSQKSEKSLKSEKSQKSGESQNPEKSQKSAQSQKSLNAIKSEKSPSLNSIKSEKSSLSSIKSLDSDKSIKSVKSKSDSSSSGSHLSKDLNSQAITNFCEYLKIPSVHPNVDYEDCVKFLKRQAVSLELPFAVHHVAPNKPVVVLTWHGKDHSLPSILLNSHMDVVPVFEDRWKYPPFDAFIDENKNIYGRGTQDMKSVGIQYLEAIRRLKSRKVILRRTVHVTFAPDEEIGSGEGMAKFVQSKAFHALNVGFALDESSPSPNNAFVVFYGERCPWQFRIHCCGKQGHGCLLLSNTAGEKASFILNKVYEFRKEQEQKLKNNNVLFSDLITINLTRMRGGALTNVVPPEFVLTFDCRLPLNADIKSWEQTITQWCKEAGPGVRIEYENREYPVAATKLDKTNIFWTAFKEATDQMEMKLKPQICMGITDARFMRKLGIPAIGFSPINHTPLLLHDHNEHLNIDIFLRGIEIYCNILISIGNKA